MAFTVFANFVGGLRRGEGSCEEEVKCGLFYADFSKDHSYHAHDVVSADCLVVGSCDEIMKAIEFPSTNEQVGSVR